MTEKNVSELIFDKFKKSIEKDDLFKEISKDLISLIHEKKFDRTKIQKLLEKMQNENSGIEN